MSKRTVSEADLDAVNRQMRSLRKKLRRLKREAAEEVTEPRAAIVIDKPPDRENATETTATSSLVDDLVEEDASEEDERSNSSTSDGESDASVEVKAMTGEAAKVTESLSNETRERLCLKTEPTQSADITLHPVLVTKWMHWMRKGLYEGDEEDHKKREEEEKKLREEVMKKFPRKGILHVEAPKLNPKILAYISGRAKSRDQHFVSSQNALGSAMVSIATGISLILELEEGDISSGYFYNIWVMRANS
ncbi:uncharacterized protein LOC113562783 [Ooceraea biroi]|uniref:uncharacterized protein LOC113562783 n=1 Tax=Ooceraea biroi TaxID=2015173 RepID=UPI000F0924AD|nr:uncharacterized protein LOC113562783 [Ooceraea biroi]